MLITMNNISKLRKMMGWTQRDLASLLGVSKTCVAGWEQGRTEPNIKMIAKLMQLFHCNFGCMFYFFDPFLLCKVDVYGSRYERDAYVKR